MRRNLSLSISLIALSLLTPGAASAEVKCPEGKTVTGDCVNPALTAAMRLTAIIFSQPKISQTAFPILPVEDYSYRYPHQLIPTPLKPAPAFAPIP
jgi:hypothetical protein